jgi:F-type H+-transporting ATPase subunit a
MFLKLLSSSAFIVFSFKSLASGFGVEIVNWYSFVLSRLLTFFLPGLSHEMLVKKVEFWSPVLASSFVVFLLFFLSLISGFFRIKPKAMTNLELLPEKKLSVKSFFEICWDIVVSTLETTLGEKHWKRFAPFMGCVFFIVLISNLSGVVPGFEPATASTNFSFAIGLVVFIIFNFYGLKESGFGYVKHMAGPVLWMAPLLFIIEFISVLSRPISLSLRVTGNISGDHFVFSIFSGILKNLNLEFLPIPAIFLGFGTFVSFLQAFIFMTLSTVYIKLALEANESH